MSRDQMPGVQPALATYRDDQVIDLIVNREGAGAALLFGGQAWSIARLEPQVLAERAQIPMDEAHRLAAAFELAHRVREERAAPHANLETTPAALSWLADRATMLDQEEAWLLSLDGELKLLGARMLAVGTRSRVALDIGTVLRHALEMGASKLVLVHNHIEGPDTPSEADIKFTLELREGATAVGMALVDHILAMREGHIISVLEFMQELAKEAVAKRKGSEKEMPKAARVKKRVRGQ